MRKNILSLSIAAMIGGLGFAGAASAAVISPANPANLTLSTTGVGNILLVPYFSAQGDNVTLLNLVNTDPKNGKAVKLRFRGAANSDDLYDITILMSPGDVWTGSVSRNGATGAAKLTTSDTTCTRPAKADVNRDFFTTRLGTSATTADTLEGYVEILNVANITSAAVGATETSTTGATTAAALFATIKHANNAAACSETVLAALDTDIVGANNTARELVMRKRGLDFPTGGLFANWTIVDWAKKGTYTGEATAIAADAAANYVMFPQNSEAVVQPTDAGTALASIDIYTADPVLRGTAPFVAPRNYDLPDLSTPYVATFTTGDTAAPISQANTLSGALATTSVTNEFITTPVTATNDIPFSTDWVFSMPSRRYAVAIAYGTTNAAVFNNGTGAESSYFTATNSKLNTAKTRVCVTPGPVNDKITFFNREENTTSLGAVVSPQVATNVEFCGETSVLTFNDTTSLLGAKIATQQITTGVSGNMFYEGWASIPTRGLGGTTGLPILGSAYVKGVSATAGNLGGTWSHRTSKDGIAP